MPNWNDVLKELQGNTRSPHDDFRRTYLQKLTKLTGRNALVYYSGWLQKPGLQGGDFAINDADKTGFMTCSHSVDRSRGLDLLLHTPGGDVAATESIIEYLHSLYDGNVRAIIPQMAMSGGTLIALSCKEIVMGRQSSLGPVDPQIHGMPAQGILEEFTRAAEEIQAAPHMVPLWQTIISRYHPTLITTCAHAVNWADELLRKFLSKCMFAGDPEAKAKIDIIAESLGKQSASKNHNRHISKDTAKALGLKIVDLESEQELQDTVLTLHHALTINFAHTAACKIIENDAGVAYVQRFEVR